LVFAKTTKNEHQAQIKTVENGDRKAEPTPIVRIAVWNYHRIPK